MNYQHSHRYFSVTHDYYLLKIINPKKSILLFSKGNSKPIIHLGQFHFTWPYENMLTDKNC